MRERIHEAYIAIAVLMGTGGIAWVLAHHHYWDTQTAAAWALILASGVLLILVLLNLLPGLRSARAPRFLRDSEFDVECDDSSWEHYIDITNRGNDSGFEVVASGFISASRAPWPPSFWSVRWKNEADARSQIGTGRTKRLELAEFDYKEFINSAIGEDASAIPPHWNFHQAGADDFPLLVNRMENGKFFILGTLVFHRVSPAAERRGHLTISYKLDRESENLIPMAVRLHLDPPPVGRIKKLRRKVKSRVKALLRHD